LLVLALRAAPGIPGSPVPVAATNASSIDGVRQALAGDPVYVAPDAEAASLVDADALRREIGEAPIAVAVLPAAARNAVRGGSGGWPSWAAGEPISCRGGAAGRVGSDKSSTRGGRRSTASTPGSAPT